MDDRDDVLVTRQPLVLAILLAIPLAIVGGGVTAYVFYLIHFGKLSALFGFAGFVLLCFILPGVIAHRQTIFDPRKPFVLIITRILGFDARQREISRDDIEGIDLATGEGSDVAILRLRNGKGIAIAQGGPAEMGKLQQRVKEILEQSRVRSAEMSAAGKSRG